MKAQGTVVVRQQGQVSKLTMKAHAAPTVQIQPFPFAPVHPLEQTKKLLCITFLAISQRLSVSSVRPGSPPSIN